LRFVNQVKTAPAAASVVAIVAIAAAICSPGVISAHGIGRTSPDELLHPGVLPAPREIPFPPPVFLGILEKNISQIG